MRSMSSDDVRRQSDPKVVHCKCAPRGGFVYSTSGMVFVLWQLKTTIASDLLICGGRLDSRRTPRTGILTCVLR
jgi:hypothetical protein